MLEDSNTFQEMITQPQALAASLKAVEEQSQDLLDLWGQGYEYVIFTGCGSTFYLSLAAAFVFQKLNHVIAAGIPGGELFLSSHLFSPPKPTQRILLVAVSRSGATSETVRVVEAFKATNVGSVITITCEPMSPLNKLGDIKIAIPEASEQSVVQTRSFVAMQMATLAMAALLAGQTKLLDQFHEVPDLSASLLEEQGGSMKKLGGDLSLDRIYFLGSGLRYGLACEGSLKMKEMTLTHTEPFHFLDFRHGPKSMITDSTLVIGLQSSERPEFENDVLVEAQGHGGRVLSLGEVSPSTRYENSVVFNSGLDPVVHSLLYLGPLQLLALARAQAKGLNPDKPHNLDAVVKLDNLRAT